MADEMLVAELTSQGQPTGAHIVVAHPGRPDPSDEDLRVMGVRRHQVVPLSKSKLKPATNAEIVEAGGQPRPSRGEMPRTAKRPSPSGA